MYQNTCIIHEVLLIPLDKEAHGQGKTHSPGIQFTKCFFFSILHTWQTLYAFMKFFELSQIKSKKLFIQNLKFLWFITNFIENIFGKLLFETHNWDGMMRITTYVKWWLFLFILNSWIDYISVRDCMNWLYIN